VHDRLSTPITHFHERAELLGWFSEAGLGAVSVEDTDRRGWRAYGFRPETLSRVEDGCERVASVDPAEAVPRPCKPRHTLAVGSPTRDASLGSALMNRATRSLSVPRPETQVSGRHS